MAEVGRSGSTQSIRQGSLQSIDEVESEDAFGLRRSWKRSGVECFSWNHMACEGTALHKAVIDGKIDDATAILHRKPTAVHDIFSYVDTHDGRNQSRTGQAIHLAASRGHTDMVDLLIASNAELTDMVTRAGKDHYNVFLAAVFAEGRNDNDAMVRKLIQLGAEFGPNADGQTPMHIAYSQGNYKLIPVLMSITTPKMQKELYGDKENSPLMLGIQRGKMTTKQLSWAAPCTSTSLHVFIHNEPSCIAEFLMHALNGGMEPSDLARSIDGSTIANVIRRHPAAACALLKGITTRPACPEDGWHPLPNRASFAARTWMQRLQHMANPEREQMVTYQKDNEWTFNLGSFQAPEWHAEEIPGVSEGPPVYDVSIEVCHVPNILCVEFFSALGTSENWAESDLFENPVIAASIDHVWWRGAYKYDVMRVIWSFWTLSLWLLEVYHCRRNRDIDPAKALLDGLLNLKAGRGIGRSSGAGASNATDITSGAEVNETLFDTMFGGQLNATDGLHAMPLTSSFIGAVGVVGMIHELIGLGSAAFRCGRGLFSIEMMYPLLRHGTQVMYFWCDRSRVLQQLVIFMTWTSILQCFTCAQTLAVALLPLLRLGFALGPPVFLTCVFFGCFMHMFQNLWDITWKESFAKCFSMLLLSSLPVDMEGQSPLANFVTYAAVLAFSIFLLNIFIGIISSAYEAEKTVADKAFHRSRALRCRNFLHRTQLVACDLTSQRRSLFFSLFAIMIYMVWQCMHLGCQVPLWASCLQVLVHSGLLLACYQTPNEFWAEDAQGSDRLPRRSWSVEEGQDFDNFLPDRFLWIATRCKEKHPTDADLFDFMKDPEGQAISAKNAKRWALSGSNVHMDKWD